MQLGVSEILAEANGLRDKPLVIDYLRKNYTKQLAIILQYTFDPNIKWLISEDFPEHEPIDYPGRELGLYSDTKLLYLFVEGGQDNLSPEKRNVLLIQLLENISEDDKHVLRHMVQKKLPYEYINYEVVKEAFPDLLPDIKFQASVEEPIKPVVKKTAKPKKEVEKPVAKKAPVKKKPIKKAPAKKKGPVKVKK